MERVEFIFDAPAAAALAELAAADPAARVVIVATIRQRPVIIPCRLQSAIRNPQSAISAPPEASP